MTKFSLNFSSCLQKYPPPTINKSPKLLLIFDLNTIFDMRCIFYLEFSYFLQIGAYGIGVNNHKEKASNPFGTVSNLVMSFKTVAWDRTLEVYSLKKFDRPDPRSLAFLTNLGRSFLTQVTLLVQPRYHLRCQTFSEFPSENLYANPNSSFYMIEESFAYLVEQFGKVEVTYFPYVDRSWVKGENA